MFIVLEWLEYATQNVIFALDPIPSYESVITIRYFVIIIFVIIYKVISEYVREIVKRNLPIIDFRKIVLG